MPPYTGPSKELTNSVFGFKFVRVDDQIVITEPNGFMQKHSELAEEEGVLEAVKEKRQTDPDAVDAGRCSFSESLNKIYVRDESDTLRLPVTRNARQNTYTVFEHLSPGYTVEKNERVYLIYTQD